jgi:hypothetical protein
VQRHGGPLGGIAAFALTAALAADNGGFDALSWNRALVLTCAVALALVIAGAADAPGRWSAVLVASLALLTAWTAASWLWSESPPLALEEAQRVALYLVVAALVALAGRRVPAVWIAGGVAGACVLVAVWNLVVRIRGDANPNETGAFTDPVGYANSLALLCVLALLLLPALPRLAWLAAVPLAATLVLQHSAGAYAALAAGVLVLGYRRAPALLALLAVIGIVAGGLSLRDHVRTAYWRVAAREAEANPVLGSGAGTFADWWLRERTRPLSTRDAHSLYLETVAELGPLGLVGVLAVFAVGIAAARTTPIGGAITAYAVGAAVDFHWELAGATVPAILLAASAAVQAAPGRRAPPRAVAIPLLGVLTAAGLLAYAGNARLADARDALASGDRDRAASLAQASLRWAPYSSAAWTAIGDAQRNAGAYERASELDPNDWYVWSRIAQLTTGEPRRHALRVAARLNPLSVR